MSYEIHIFKLWIVEYTYERYGLSYSQVDPEKSESFFFFF